VNTLHSQVYEKLAPTRTIWTRNPLQIANPRIGKAFKRDNNLFLTKQETKRLKRAIKKERSIIIENKSKSPNIWDFVKCLYTR